MKLIAAILIVVFSTVASLYMKTTEEELGLIATANDLTVVVHKNISFNIIQRTALGQDVRIKLIAQHPDLISFHPTEFTIGNSKPNQIINVQGLKPGHLELWAESTSNDPWITSELFVRITVENSEILAHISIVVGCIYSIAWALAIYPQIYSNFKRKSVVGLSFDFIALNSVGHLMYAIFNTGLFWIPEIQAEYAARHPRGLNPVLFNDVFFSLDSLFPTTIVIIQSVVYERGEQRVSKLTITILTVITIIIIVSLILVLTATIQWLDVLYYCSYIKLALTIMKYTPQAFMNYRRKSTIGRSIESILLDFVGGILSMLQMILNAYNYDDWVSIFGDPTKFGLGLFSVVFDVIFMLQHYVLYRHANTISKELVKDGTYAQATKYSFT